MAVDREADRASLRLPPNSVLGAPVVLALAVFFAAALAYDGGAMAGATGGAGQRQLFATQVARASVLPGTKPPGQAVASLAALLMLHGLLTASIVIFLAALARRRGSEYFGSPRALKLVLFCVFFRTGASVAFSLSQTDNYVLGLAAWASGGLSWLGLARAFAKEGNVAYPSRWKSVPFFMGNHKHIPVVGYAIGGLLSCLAMLPRLRHVVEVASLAVVFGDLAAIHKAWSMLPHVLPSGDGDGGDGTIEQKKNSSSSSSTTGSNSPGSVRCTKKKEEKKKYSPRYVKKKNM